MGVLCDHCVYRDSEYGCFDGAEFPFWRNICVNPMVVSKNPNKTYCPLYQQMTCEICYWYSMNPKVDLGYCAADMNKLLRDGDFESLQKSKEDGVRSLRKDGKLCMYGYVTPVRTCQMCKYCDDINYDGKTYECVCHLSHQPFTVEFLEDFGCTMWEANKNIGQEMPEENENKQ